MTHNADPDEIEMEPWAVNLRADDALFVREFLVDFNAYQALVRSGCKPATARSYSTYKVRRPDIARAIAAAMQDRADALSISARTVLSEAFRCYMGAVAAKNWNAAARFLEMVGRHVDVRAFRERVGIADDEDRDAAADVRNLSREDLELYARLERKRLGLPAPEAASPIRH